MLETLHICNSPLILTQQQFNSDDLFNGLASQMFETLSGPVSQEIPLSVNTIGLGSPTYSDVRMGTYHHGNMFDFTRLRVYHLYSGKPRLVAKGVCDEAEGICENLNVFRPFRF